MTGGALAGWNRYGAIAAPMLVAPPTGFDPATLPARARAVPFVVRQDGAGTQLCLTWEGWVEEFDFRRVSAGMAGNATLAAFLRAKNPYTSGGMLTVTEARDLAAYINSQCRPGGKACAGK